MTAQRIAAYLDRGLSPEERENFEQHVFVCSECRADLAEATDLLGSERSRRPAWVVPLAAAAGLVALSWIASVQFMQPTFDGTELRGAGTTSSLEVVSPVHEAAVDPDLLMFVWRAASNDVYYEFTLTDAIGDVVFAKGQSDTTLVLPRSVGLERGAMYFWYVDALLDGARSTSTGALEFFVNDP